MRRRTRRENPAVTTTLVVGGVAFASLAAALWWLGSKVGEAVGTDDIADTVTESAKIAAAYPKMATYADEIVRVAGTLGGGAGIKPAWLANAINFESSGNPQAHNPSGATGLIQFMDATARELGTTTAALMGMSGRQQMAFVERYFRLNRIPTVRSQLDVFMAIYYPYAIGKGTDYVIGSEKGAQYVAKVQAANPGIKTSGDYYRLAMRNARMAA
jgi:hypothetical protein